MEKRQESENNLYQGEREDGCATMMIMIFDTRGNMNANEISVNGRRLKEKDTIKK